MKRFVAVAAASLLFASCHDAPLPTAPTARDASPDLAVAVSPHGEMIVLLDPARAPDGHEQNQAAARQVARELGVEPRHAYGTAVFGFSGAVPEGRLQALARDPRVVHVEEVEAWELAVDFAALALAQSTSQVLPTGIDRAEVDKNPTVTTDGTGTKAVGLDI
ncbi:MAG TPA: protease inhibitor I9 family protein, partial [Longimicrobiales bacterium]|nr:protease inhibitor I9 family protein [Longimicrobiales bacterium]